MLLCIFIRFSFKVTFKDFFVPIVLYIWVRLPFDFFIPKIGVLHGLLQGINSPCSFKFSIMGSNPKAVAPYFRTLAWQIPWMEEPGRLQSMGSLRVGHD